MIIPQEGNQVYVIVGTPVFNASDDEALGWVEAIMITIEDKIDFFESTVSPFKLEQTGLGCIVSYCFDNVDTANGIAEQLNEIAGDQLYFFAIGLAAGSGGDNEKKVRKVYFSISVMCSAPYNGETHMFIADAEYADMSKEPTVDVTENGSVFTVYSTSKEAAEEKIWEIIEAELADG